MGHREDLLTGAKRCLYERGYAHTTARDIVAASGTNLASIGYHFGSVEALLNAAMIQAIEEWSEALKLALTSSAASTSVGMEQFEVIWTRIIESFETDRQLWVATFEALVQAERSPAVRAFLAEALDQGRMGLAELFQGIDPTSDEALAWKIGSFYQALLTGVWVQWLIDSERAPSGADIATALRAIQASFHASASPDTKSD
ncbi:MAG TPA: TetR/AcrR family transcriptional regulator [Roseiflexaceae bacterium]|nr:TetR/AcrR family transcriptional regulator [Roseiflexaceae bacterium]